VGAANACLALPRALVKHSVERRQKAIEAMHAHFEFERRKFALKTARTHQKLRTSGCTFDEILDLTNPIKHTEVIEHYCDEEELSDAQREQLLRMAAGAVPWFVALSLTAYYVSAIAITILPPIAVCDPAFVAEMPGSKGVLLKIGHFDQVGGVMHVEL
jgi:hypothetical protein